MSRVQELGLWVLVPVDSFRRASLGLPAPIRGDLDAPGERGPQGLQVMLSDFEKDLFALRRIYFFKVRWVFFSAQSGAASACWRCLVLTGDCGPPSTSLSSSCWWVIRLFH